MVPKKSYEDAFEHPVEHPKDVPDQDPFKEYIKESEPAKREKGYAWQTAIGLQAVDGLQPSKYLLDTAIRNIEGEISLEDAQQLCKIITRRSRTRMRRIGQKKPIKCLFVLQHFFQNMLSALPQMSIWPFIKSFLRASILMQTYRDYNITKKEWVLNGATVLYASASELRATLEYDFSQEKKFSYKNLSMDEIIHHLAVFVAGLWQIHVFGEGNTRTTAVFFIKYLSTLGFAATNNIFASMLGILETRWLGLIIAI
mgnify:CR=1 FL=1